MEFQSDSVLKEFYTMFNASYPENTSDRQKGDVMCAFLAGYHMAGVNSGAAVEKLGLEGGMVFMDEMFNDNHERIKFLIDCMVRNDYSHKMFTDPGSNNER